MKVGLPAYMPTADEMMTVQAYGHENGKAISYENPSGIFIVYACGTRASCLFHKKTSVIMQYPEPI